MDDTRPGAIGCVGAGRLAASLAAGLQAAGYPVAMVASRDPASARALAGQLGAAVRAASPREVASTCDLVVLTVPDGEIARVCAELPWAAGQSVVHCSGAIDLQALAPAAAAGAATGCLHPIQSFPSREGDAARFRGITCGVEAGEPLARLLEGIAHALGAAVVRLEGIDRARYHAAAVFASNYVVALAAAARRTWELAGLPGEQARGALAPQLVGSAGNVAAFDLARALTGPLARGDVSTIERHLAALVPEPSLVELYRRLGAELLALPLGHDGATLERLRSLFEAPGAV